MTQIERTCENCASCIFDAYEHNGTTMYGEPIGCSTFDDFEHQLCAQSNDGCDDFSQRIED